MCTLDIVIEVARERKASIIVMGSRGRTGLPHLLMGSVAEKVVRDAPCPVFMVKPESFNTMYEEKSLEETVTSY